MGDYVEHLEGVKWVKGYRVTRVSREKSGIYYGIRNNRGYERLLVNENYIRPSIKSEIIDCKSLEDFQALAAKRGYKQGWAYYRWTKRQNRRLY